MSHLEDIAKAKLDIVHLARLALSGRRQDTQLHLRRMEKRWRAVDPEVARGILEVLRDQPTAASPLRDVATPVPVDSESRLSLVRQQVVTDLPVEPIFDPTTSRKLEQIVGERQNAGRLLDSGLSPSRSALFVGPPGVGKSLAAHWLAMRLALPLLTLDLAAVMSSFLGRTGGNVRHVLDFAKSFDCILLLDEFDAIAKRRDDAAEIGELKRLVTVLLQEVDDWPSTGLLLAATNHESLLDPAVWRRFDVTVEFPMPTEAQVRQAAMQWLPLDPEIGARWAEVLAVCFHGASFSDVHRAITQCHRAAALGSGSIEEQLGALVGERSGQLARADRAEMATWLVTSGLVSQREAHRLTGTARETIRRRSGAAGPSRKG